MPNIVRQDDVRRRNQFNILRLLRRHGPLSRTAMSALTGLSASTVTVITNSLIERGVITDQSQDSATVNKRGRPQVQLLPQGKLANVVILRLARGHAEGTIYDYGGKPLASHEINKPTRSLDAQGVIGLLSGIVDILLEQTGVSRTQVARIAVAVEGIVDGAGSQIMCAPVADVHNVPLAQTLEAEFSTRVEILNDCNAVAEGLSWRAPERYGQNFAVVLLSMGVGLGLLLDGHMFSGPNSSAMEFGHMVYKPGGALCRCGRSGCIEAYASIYSMWRSANGEDPNTLMDAEPPESVLDVLLERARAGDGPALRAFSEAGSAIGNGLVNLFTLFDSVPLVFAGPGTGALEFMMEDIKKAFENRSFGLKVEPEIIDVNSDATQLMREGTLMRSLMAIDLSIPDQGEAILEYSSERGDVNDQNA
jgi:predicted NBD/HSP70 family sugar kinase